MRSQNSPLADLMTMDDADLVLLARTDKSAFSELYHRHFNRIFRYEYSVTGSTIEAQELTAQTFMSAVAEISSFHEETSFADWLTGFAHYKASVFFQTHESVDSPVSASTPLEKKLLGSQPQLSDLIKALRKLPREHSEAITLRLFADLTASQVAQILDISEPEIKLFFFQGIKDLKKQLISSHEVDG